MRLASRILVQLKSTYDGTAWHGTPLRRMLDGIDDAKANAHPIANTRSIAELTAHVAAWVEIVERRARGEEFDVTPEMDFPSAGAGSWSDLVSRLERAYARLVETVSGMSDEALDANVPGKSYTQAHMLLGLAHHGTYHAAQIAVLKK